MHNKSIVSLTHRNKEKPHTSQNILDAVLNVPFLLLLAQAGKFLKAWHGTNLTVQSSTSSNTSEMNWNTGCEPGQASSPVSAGPHCCSCIWAETLLYQINPNDPGISENPIKNIYLYFWLLVWMLIKHPQYCSSTFKFLYVFCMLCPVFSENAFSSYTFYIFTIHFSYYLYYMYYINSIIWSKFNK